MDRKTIAMLALGLMLGGGLIGAYQVMAQGTSTAKAPVAVQQAQQQEVQSPLYHGSITVNAAKYQGKSEQDESKALASLAKITAGQARQAAEAKVGGTASSVELGNENGTLVYEVKIGKKEVKVDAGNGAILRIGQGDNEQKGNEEKGVESESKKGGDFEKDGIAHNFEGQAEHTD